MENSKFIISRSALENLNVTRKRSANQEEWRDRSAKLKKDAGLEYESRNGTLRFGLDRPAGRKVCSQDCTKEGCSISPARKNDLFDQFRSVPGDVQSALLMVCVQRERPRRHQGAGQNRTSSYRYFLPDEEGFKKEACMKTIMDVFSVTEGRLKILKEKIKSGIFAPTDGRGQHNTRPHKVSQQMKDDVVSHIESYPSEICHYSRSKGHPERKYLGAELNATKMLKSFQAAVGEDSYSKSWLYRKTLKDMDLHFDTPKSDTCCTCDKYKIGIQAAQTPDEKDAFEWDMIRHTVKWECAYDAMRTDIAESSNNPNLITVALDLQQVLFSPVLTNSEYFYQRKYSSYNFGMTFPANKKTVFSFWTESTAKRGSDEIGSGILRTIRAQFPPLNANTERKLSMWNDCCGGQNKNWMMICLYFYLAQAGHFTEITQNFLVTGHTFLPTDRDFGVIERAKRGAKISMPSDWVNLIKSCRPDNPFEVNVLTQQEIFKIRDLAEIILKPRSLKFPGVAAFRIDVNQPNTLFTKCSHEPDTTWDEHNLILKKSVQEIRNYIFVQKYNNPLPVSAAKKQDLVKMCDYLGPEGRQFYENL